MALDGLWQAPHEVSLNCLRISVWPRISKHAHVYDWLDLCCANFKRPSLCGDPKMRP